MGSGPTSLLACKYKPRGAILMSPYTTIKDVAKNVVGGFLSMFVQEHFNNLEMMKKVKCPVLLIHGESDTLIPSAHSHKLFETLINQRDFDEVDDTDPMQFAHLPFCNVVFNKAMTHNDFNLASDILNPMKEFLASCDIMQNQLESQ